mmetsp:Transcript_11252/g.35914  ORF Transcript_11252/g.35914 Transcript_11252/m.35914 type:complete len:217 (-) Transcript_11252:1542-2192(-)
MGSTSCPRRPPRSRCQSVCVGASARCAARCPHDSACSSASKRPRLAEALGSGESVPRCASTQRLSCAAAVTARARRASRRLARTQRCPAGSVRASPASRAAPRRPRCGARRALLRVVPPALRRSARTPRAITSTSRTLASSRPSSSCGSPPSRPSPPRRSSSASPLLLAASLSMPSVSWPALTAPQRSGASGSRRCAAPRAPTAAWRAHAARPRLL